MTKEKFLALVAQVYRAANTADSEAKADWMKPELAGTAGCQHLDRMLWAMLESEMITKEEHQALYDTL